ncbi:unnamed protein product [Haemonchus placei]|uniref:Uncharacterized protein n=1 Tax=Haemonchus placei TaxID=6290 RepID=A0A0N4W933_HAEPC|nr:unnamed protein product [Haemonchus placei]
MLSELVIFSESRLPAATPSVGSRCRSRSNSWRARPCTILKEESEEELSSYLRSSRHSSRSFSVDVHSARDASPLRVPVEDVRDVPRSLVLTKPPQFDDLSPIAEHGSPTVPLSINDSKKSTSELVAAQRRAMFARTLSCGANNTARSRFSRSDDEDSSGGASLSRRQSYAGLLDFARRNSSPSISMFSGTRDRVSPQAVQDLMELCRLGKMLSLASMMPIFLMDIEQLPLCFAGGSRRAVSPESIRSSRSPSPPTSSGRASPGLLLSVDIFALLLCDFLKSRFFSLSGDYFTEFAYIAANEVADSAMSSLSSLSRLKIATSSLGGGMRKLSSSPHLLGICEEGEDVDSNTVLLTTSRQGSTRSNSCSSSEASDDEEGKRLSILGSMYCGRKRDGDNDRDDTAGGQGIYAVALFESYYIKLYLT